MTFLEATNYAAGADFQSRVRFVLVKAARAALAETPANPSKVAYARQVLNDPERYARMLSIGVMTLPVVATLPANATIADVDLEAAVLGVLGDYVKATL